jgi:hypothetical protein
VPGFSIFILNVALFWFTSWLAGHMQSSSASSASLLLGSWTRIILPALLVAYSAFARSRNSKTDGLIPG